MKAPQILTNPGDLVLDSFAGSSTTGARCEWGHDDYSLNVANLPMAAPSLPSPPAPLPQADEGRNGRRVVNMEPDLFGDRGENAP